MRQSQATAYYTYVDEYDNRLPIDMPSQRLTVLGDRKTVGKESIGIDKSRVVSILPQTGAVELGESKLFLGMTPESVHRIFMKPETTLCNFGSHKHISERHFDRALTLQYWDMETLDPTLRGMTLYEFVVQNRNGWQVKVDGMSLFDDKALRRVKMKYRHMESRERSAVAFPTLGILVINCHQEENGEQEGNKTVFFCTREAMRSYVCTINQWD
jgi:hypothetical protein